MLLSYLFIKGYFQSAVITAAPEKGKRSMIPGAATTNEDPSICARCGGDCCKTLPGIEWPERFLDSPDPVVTLMNLLLSGDWVLATHYGIPYKPENPPPDEIRFKKIYYPRPATVEESGKGPLAQDAVGSCCLLGTDGCRLEFQERPRLCRELVPEKSGHCSARVNKGDAALAWLPHQHIVLDALRGMGF
jgi:hypothetical protein